MREVLRGLLWSTKCKIPEPWFSEIRYALKHCPSPWDVTVEGKTFKDFDRINNDIDDFAKFVKRMDDSVVAKKRRSKKK